MSVQLPYPEDRYSHDVAHFISEIEIETDAVKQAKQLEVEGVAQAEAGHTDRALELFSEAIHIAPEHSSSFNNRAQALRLQGDTQGIYEPQCEKTGLRVSDQV